MRNFLVIGFAQGAVYGLVALGLALVYKGARVFNFAQGEFGTVAAFMAWLLLQPGPSWPVGLAVGSFVALAVTLVTAGRLKRRLAGAPREPGAGERLADAALAVGAGGRRAIRALAPLLRPLAPLLRPLAPLLRPLAPLLRPLADRAAGGGSHRRHRLRHLAGALAGLLAPALVVGAAAGSGAGGLAVALVRRPAGWPVALPLALGTAVVMGLAVERVVVRRLFDAPRVTLLVATAGVALLAIALELILGEAQGRVLRPFVGGDGVVLFDVQLPPQRIVMLAAVPVVAVVLAWFFSRTDLGLAILAMSQEPVATRLAGIRIRRTSAAVWGLAALLGGLAGLLQAPIIPFFPGEMTTHALLPGFTAAVLGGITSLGGALAGGFAVGVVQSLGQYFIGERIPGGGDLVVFLVLLGVLLFRPRGLFGSPTPEVEAASVGQASQRLPFVPANPSRAGWVLRRGVLAAIVVGVLVAPRLLPPFRSDQISLALIYAMIGLSMNVLMGYAGQISLGHQAFVGIGAFTSAILVTEHGFSFWVAIAAAAATGAVAAAILGLVALRLRGLYLALITLAYGTVAQRSIFGIPELTRGGAGMPAPRPPGFTSDHAYTYLCFGFLALLLFVDWRYLSSKAGRAILAIRQNEAVAASYAIDVVRYKVFAFVVAGVYAGVAGALFAHWRQVVVDVDFSFTIALTFVLMTVVGGLGSRVGVVIGSMFFALFPLIFNTLTVWVPLIGSVLLLNTLTHFPGGIGQQLAPLVLWLRGGKVALHRGPREGAGRGAA